MHADTDKLSGIRLSVVVPCYNEEQNVGEVCRRLKSALDGGEGKGSYELIFVDDGSSDGTYPALRKLRENDRERVKVVRLRRNFGQTAALRAGFDKARGEVIVTLDGDLQNDPGDIPGLLRKMEEGYDLVSGWRRKRADSLFSRRIPSFLANRLIALLTGVRLHDFGCTLKAYRREIVKQIDLYGEMHRLIPVLASWMGARIAEMEVSHQRRLWGKSNYSLSRTLTVLLDLIALKFFLSYSTRPIHIFGFWGVVCLGLSLIAGAILIFMKLYQGVDMTGNPFLFLTIMLVIVGVQFIVLGLLGEVGVRTYYESQKKPIYLAEEEREEI
jgi:glycosyltransferase involved in cell wall biosynthesis